MKDPDYCQCCQLKISLESSNDKFELLKEKLPNFGQLEYLSTLTQDELECSLCLMDVLIDALVNDKLFCSNRKIVHLVTTQLCIENQLELRKVQEELQQEMEKYERLQTGEISDRKK